MIGIKRVANGLEGDSTAFSYYYYNSTYMNKTILNDHMISFITSAKAQKKLTEYTRLRRLRMDLTQEGLAMRSGVPLSSLRKFEQKGTISLESFLKLHMVLGGLEDIVEALEHNEASFSSIDDVLKSSQIPVRRRGRRK